MYEDIIELNGKEAGPTSMILVGVHGNEKCGIEAVKKILPSLEIQRGRVLIGYGNPKAIEQNVRYTDSNLNRMFKPDQMLSEKEKASYEYIRSQFLRKYLDQADALLDIHASLTPASQKFVICEKNAEAITKYLPFSKVVSGFDKEQPGGTDYYMNRQGKIGICIECGYFDDTTSTEIAEKSMISFLTARGNITGNLKDYSQTYIQINSMYITKINFVLSKQFKDFEEVTIDHLIGIDGKDEIKAQSDGVILFARNRNRAGEEAFLFGKKNSLT